MLNPYSGSILFKILEIKMICPHPAADKFVQMDRSSPKGRIYQWNKKHLDT